MSNPCQVVPYPRMRSLMQDASVTPSFDHDIVDGAPAARIAQRFVQRVEEGYALEG